MNRFTRRNAAFTLIELLIVVAIIGIIVAIAVLNFKSARIKAMISRVIADQRVLSDAVRQYKLDNGILLSERADQLGYWPAQHSQPVFFNLLTTPIQYLSNAEAVDDPFQKASWATFRRSEKIKEGIYDQDDELGQRYGWIQITPGYHDPTLFVNASRRFPKALEWRGADVPGIFEYMIVSRGPDLLMNIDIDEKNANPSYRQVYLPYDPSNGLTSNGDIFNLGP